MANLKRRHAFKRWAPDIGENRDLDEPAIWFELATGLTDDQLCEVREVLGRPIEPQPKVPAELKGDALTEFFKARIETSKANVRARMTDALGPYVRIAGGPHSIDGSPLVTLEDYLCIVQRQADFGSLAMKDLLAAHRAFNNFGGGDELFLLRRSGSSASTAAPSVVKVEPKTDGP